jgi:hypothetical protein
MSHTDYCRALLTYVFPVDVSRRGGIGRSMFIFSFFSINLTDSGGQRLG